MGQQIFNATGNFTNPYDVVLDVTICMCGAGGSGAAAGSDMVGYPGGGGYGGEEISATYTLQPLEVIAVIVGIGGSAKSGSLNGSAGGYSEFGTRGRVEGGAGGVQGVLYNGDGAARSSCGGTFYDGSSYTSGGSTGWGGQAGVFGDGGDGDRQNDAGAGGVGAGGGGVTNSDNNGTSSGAGGNGRVVVNWDDIIIPTGGNSVLINGTQVTDLTGEFIFGVPAIDEIDYPNGLVSINSLEVDGTPVWHKTREAPAQVLDFASSVDEVGQLTLTWTNPSYAYNGNITTTLYIEDGTVIQNAESGYVHTLAAGSYDCYVTSANVAGQTDSNHFTGIAL